MSYGSQTSITLLELWERQSARSNTYFSGYWGGLQVALLRDGERPHPTRPDETVMNPALKDGACGCRSPDPACGRMTGGPTGLSASRVVARSSTPVAVGPSPGALGSESGMTLAPRRNPSQERAFLPAVNGGASSPRNR
jgi:hypothetical protein